VKRLSGRRPASRHGARAVASSISGRAKSVRQRGAASGTSSIRPFAPAESWSEGRHAPPKCNPAASAGPPSKTPVPREKRRSTGDAGVEAARMGPPSCLRPPRPRAASAAPLVSRTGSSSHPGVRPGSGHGGVTPPGRVASRRWATAAGRLARGMIASGLSEPTPAFMAPDSRMRYGGHGGRAACRHPRPHHLGLGRLTSPPEENGRLVRDLKRGPDCVRPRPQG